MMAATMQRPTLPDLAARKTALTAVDRSLLVEAGAGSGKTSIMAGRIAVLLAGGVEPKHIAAITFTEFAASELQLRVDRGLVPQIDRALFMVGLNPNVPTATKAKVGRMITLGLPTAVYLTNPGPLDGV